MSLKIVSENQPKNFQFTKESMDEAEREIKKYPSERKASAVMSLLYLAQSQNENWIPLEAIKYIAKLLNISYIQVYEVATFYSMFNLSPVGKYFVQVCTTSPCLIRGADKVVKICKERISEEENTLSENKLCSWLEVECLGACVNAPMMQINDDYYEDLDEENTIKIIDSLVADKPIKSKSFRNRTSSAPEKNRPILNGGKNA
jgi:NADH-quinone oxidoreductase subunit E